MNNNIKLLFGIITKSHTELALDEMNGLKDLGYNCQGFEYGAKKSISSAPGRLFIVVLNALQLLIKCYRFKPDIIYLNSRIEYIASTRDFITIIIIKSLYIRKVKFTLKSHGSDLDVLLTKKFLFSKLIFPYLLKNIDGWLLLSMEEITWLRNQKIIPNNRLFLVKNIVRPYKFQIDKNFHNKMNIPLKNDILLFIGRLITEKGILDVIEAFHTINIKNQFALTLLIVGDGPELSRVKETISKYQLEDKVILTGWVDENEAAWYTSNSDILIFPTYYPEGFPMVIFNALTAGLPIITTPVRAAIDYLDQPQNCIWVEPKNPKSIEQAIITLLSNRALTSQIKFNNKNAAVNFTKEVVALETEKIINAIKNNTHSNEFLEIKKHVSVTA